jgi:hypothetical protein
MSPSLSMSPMHAPFALPGLRKATPDGGLKEVVMFLNDPF